MTILMIGAGSFALAKDVDTKRKWIGVDETVVQAFAKEAGMPARAPYINTDQGDLLLFLFLVSGFIGGFVMGYCYKQLFAPEHKRKSGIAHK
ncbi:Core component CbiM of cobalt ECF transporter / Cobalt ECF transporter, additional substrate-binding protein CbiN [hydrothermal vent metagenome]|uniref:Core component CbiM of cobalt ECF transporter / Cobalt ECF transporter, additional substrate-binding protein CbiN n=1 Tax=hydrothermal vent metagenome TaxID=652676 RepID=A0A3B1BZ88_9ZZZZ